MGWSSWREGRRFERHLAEMSGHADRKIWFLPPFVLVLALNLYVFDFFREKDASGFSAVFWSVLTVLMAVVFVLFRVEKYRAQQFLKLLYRSRSELEWGRVAWRGEALTRASQVVQYEVCVSMFVLYAQFRTSYFPRGGGRAMQVLSTLLVLLFGWWSLTGPFITVPTLILNVRGGVVLSVEDLIDSLPA